MRRQSGNYINLSIEVNNVSRSAIADSLFITILKEVINNKEFAFLQQKSINISFAIVSPRSIRKLNRIYRHIDQVTDVLSFPEYENSAAIGKEKNKELFLGEVVLCYNDIKNYAKKEKKDFEEELIKVIAHGILHLLGMAHGKKMFLIQDKVIKGLKNK